MTSDSGQASAAAGEGISRRAVLGGVGLGGVALGVGLGGSSALAAPTVGFSPAAVAAETAATPAVSGLRYLSMSGCDVRPLVDTLGWVVDGGSFRFRTAGNAHAAIPCPLPNGSTLREVEIYATLPPAAALEVYVFRKDFATGTVAGLGSDIQGNAGALVTLTVPLDVVLDTTGGAVAIELYIADVNVVSGATLIHGARIGYVPAPSFVPYAPIPRPYNTRDTAGLTKLAPGEERSVTLPVPPSASAAVLQLTVTDTGPAGFVSVYPGGSTWPGNSSINWSATASNVGNTVITAVSPDGTVTLRGGGSPTHVIVDVPGYLL